MAVGGQYHRNKRDSIMPSIDCKVLKTMNNIVQNAAAIMYYSTLLSKSSYKEM